VNWIYLGPGEGLVVGFCEHGNEHLASIKYNEFHQQLSKY
jgi:hypothetical protein